MTQRLQALRGMPDVLPKDTPFYHRFEKLWLALVTSYGYAEIRLPILENTALFKRSIGEVTDIVEKEMFTFQDRDNESITLRPEATAGCVRAGIEHGLLYNQIQRLWYIGAMFRYEKPQQGRYRQFSQIGVEAFGLAGPDIDIEQILMMYRFWRMLGVEKAVQLEINTLGNEASRKRFREQLIAYFTDHEKELDEDSRRRLKTNPLRILDSKNPAMALMLQNAPQSHDYLENEDKDHFDAFQQGLKDLKVPFILNPRIVRGLDYYNRTVYEWTTDKLGAQSAVCAGGRYDDLVAQLNGKPTPGVGFAAGMERIVLLQQALACEKPTVLDAYLVAVGQAQTIALKEAEYLRDQCRGLNLMVNCGGGDLKSQFKRADKSQAQIAIILGPEELANQSFGVKFLREERAQTLLPREHIGKFLTEFFGKFDKGEACI